MLLLYSYLYIFPVRIIFSYFFKLYIQVALYSVGLNLSPVSGDLGNMISGFVYGMECLLQFNPFILSKTDQKKQEICSHPHFYRRGVLVRLNIFYSKSSNLFYIHLIIELSVRFKFFSSRDKHILCLCCLSKNIKSSQINCGLNNIPST